MSIEKHSINVLALSYVFVVSSTRPMPHDVRQSSTTKNNVCNIHRKQVDVEESVKM